MKKKQKVDRLEETIFSKEALTISHQIIKEHAKIIFSKENLRKNYDIITYGEKHEVYAKTIWQSYIELFGSIQKLEHNIIFLSIKNPPVFFKKNGLTEEEYYKYHIENHYIKITSLIDYVTKFIHDVFRIGLPARKCNVYAITENLNTKKTIPGKELDKLDKHFTELKKHRNIIIHQGNFTNKEIEDLNNSIIDLFKEDKILSKLLKDQKQVELNKIINRMKKDNNEITSFIIKIINGLTPYFKMQYEFLKSQ